MTEAAAATKKEVQFSVNEEQGTVTIGNAKVEVSADGKKVTAYTNDGVETKAAAATDAAAEGTKISISKDFNAVVLNGVTIEQAADGHLVITAPGGVVINKPAPANDTAIKAAKDALELGTAMADGSVYAGKAADGRLILAMPNDLDVTMTFNDAAKAVKTINKNKSLGHDDWEIPSLENVRILQKNKDEGALKGSFNLTGSKASGSDFPDWYWSSTEDRDYPSCVLIVRFSDGHELWHHKDDIRLSCRPVRLVAASSAPAPK